MSILLPSLDPDPRGEFVDPEDFYATITDEEVAVGLYQGEQTASNLMGPLPPPLGSRARALGGSAAAVQEAERLAAHISAYGVTVRIELQRGVSTSGWLGVPKVGETSHHTVSRRSMGPTPCLALVKRGRSDVGGPLCNGYMGYDEVYRIITMGWANHPGLGGPITLAGRTIPLNNGRPYLWGTEFEGGLDESDFTPSYRHAMAAANAGILDYFGLPTLAHTEHKTWAPTRKIDRLGYTAAIGRAEIDAIRGHQSEPAKKKEEIDMYGFVRELYGHYTDRFGEEVDPRQVFAWVQQARDNKWSEPDVEAAFRGNPSERGTVRRAFSIFLGREPAEEEYGTFSGFTIDQTWRNTEHSPERG